MRRALTASLVLIALVFASEASAASPTIAKVTPTSGPPGTAVTITGTALAKPTQVRFGATDAQSYSGGDKKLVAVVAYASTSGPITVTTAGGSAQSAGSFTVLPPPPPQITAISPMTVPAGSAITITGSSFLGATGVQFNGVDAESFEVVSNNQIRAVLAEGTTSGGVSVTTPTGTGRSPVPLNVPPRVVEFGDCGSAGGRTDVLNGTRIFLRTGWVMANASYLSQFLTRQTTSLTINGKSVKKPNAYWDTIGQPHASGGWVTYLGYDTRTVLATTQSTMRVGLRAVAKAQIADGFGTHPIGSALWPNTTCTIRSLPLAQSSGMHPDHGPVGMPFSMFGDNLQYVTAVKFGSASAPFVYDGAAIRGRIPAGADNGRPILVESTAATVLSPSIFTLEPSVPLALHRAIPSAAEVGSTVTLRGDGFFRVTSVKFGGTNAVVPELTVDSSDTTMTVTVPPGAHTGPITISNGTETVETSSSFRVLGAAGGRPDLDFGVNGVRVVDPDPTGWEESEGVAGAVQDDGKIVVVGTSRSSSIPSSARPALVKLTSTGSRDATFGTNGAVVEPAPASGYFTAADVAIQSDGKILFVGSTGIGGGRFQLTRYLADGTRDETFGLEGVVTSDFYSAYTFGSHCGAQAHDVEVQTDGKIVVAGDACGVVGVVRFLSDGAVDTTFGTNGQVLSTLTLTGPQNDANKLLVQPDGKLVIAGSAATLAGADLFVIRLNADGSADTSFGTAGKLFVPGSVMTGASSAALDGEGNIVVLGRLGIYRTDGWAIGRIDGDGAVDTTFGGGTGFLTESLTGFIAGFLPYTVVVPATGGVVILEDGLLARYEDDGSRDETFGGEPMRGIQFHTGFWKNAALQPDGKLVTVGSAATADGFKVGRFLLEPTITP